ncbi:MAG: hypothetical protein WCN98_00770 [Verrucomicrobiaceae bacterium]
MKLRKLISLPGLMAAVVAMESIPALSTVSTVACAAVVLGATAPSAQALPRDRAAGRQGARDSRQDGRQTSRARRRGYYACPAGAVAFSHGGYRYYRVGGRYYYPYFYGGRTVYIDIDVNGGYPVPPPPAGSIDIDINF